MLFIVGLKHIILGVNQICDNGNDVIFKKHGYETRRISNRKIVSHGTRTFGNLYTLMENVEDSCMMILVGFIDYIK